MKETSSIKTTASAPLKQDVQPSVTMLKKRKKKRKKKKKRRRNATNFLPVQENSSLFGIF